MDAMCNCVRKPLLFCSLLFLSTLNATSAFGQTTARIVETINNANRITLPGNVPPLARAEFDRGDAAPSQPMNRILLLLKRSDAQEAALQSYLDQQQDKSSPNYHQWLSPADFGALYGPADEDVQAITQWLASQGFTINKVYSSKTIIEFSGSAAQVQAAFGATIHNFQINGKTYVANANNPQIPAALAPVVAGIVSLNNFPRQSHTRLAGQVQKIAGKPGLIPLFNMSGGFYAVGPADFATIYHSQPLITAGNDGTGQTIAVVGETNISIADVQAFRQTFALPANFDSSNIILNGEDPGITSTGEELEADLDVQWTGAVAPGATVKFVVSASTPASAGIDLSALYIVENNLAGVLSESYGSCESALGAAGNAFYNSLWEQAAAQGITAVLSAGDGGSAGCDDFNNETVATQGLAVSGLASTPYNVALGGTDFDQVNKFSTYWSSNNNSTTGLSALGYIPEIPWNQNCAQISLTGCGSSAPQGSLNIVAGSGGPSNTYPKPKWQMGVTGMPNDNHRDLPDVALFASAGFNGSGYIVCAGTGIPSGTSQCNLSQGDSTFSVVGGTSASAPAFAGIIALVNQYQAAHGGAPRQGNANYVLYPLAKKSGASCTSTATEAAGCVFNDVTKGNSVLPTGGVGLGTNSVPCKGTSLNCSSSVAAANGVLVDPAHTTTEAWIATAGYDMATGLGSVNINNLVTKWGSVSTVATTTTLTLNPTTGITHGSAENVTVNVTVTPTTGTAAGDVSLIAQFADGSTQGLDQFTLNSSGKIVSATTNSLPGGNNYQVYAHYTGDGTNAPSDSAPVSVTVTKENSKTFIVVPTFDPITGSLLNGNASSFVYGTSYIIRMYVTNRNAVANPTGPPSPTCDAVNSLTCPTGIVSLQANGTAFDGGTFSLNTSGYTRDITPSLGGGTYSLTADYGGDNSYQPSSSAVDTITISPATTAQQWQSYPNSTAIGQPFQLAVSIGTGVAGVAPTGTVTFYDGSAAMTGPVTYAAFGVGYNVTLSATGTVSLSTAGNHAITARYSGDSNYGPSTSPAVTVVGMYTTTMKMTESSTNINYGQSVTLTATVTSSGKTPPMSGQLQFFGNEPIPGTIATTLGTDANGNQVLTGVISTVPQFTEGVSANYTNDPLYLAGTVFGDVIVVNIPDFSIPNGNPLNISVGDTKSETFNITPLSSTPSTVALSIASDTPPGFTFTLNPTSVKLNGAPVPLTLTVATIGAPSSTVVRAATIGNLLYGRPLGLWWFLSWSSVFTFLALLIAQKRRASYLLTIVAAIALICLVLGCGGGGGNGGGGGGATKPTISIATSNSRVPFQGSFNLTATVTSSKPLTGTVTFAQNGVNFGSGVPLVNGQATISEPNFGTPQIVTFTASYSGDNRNAPAQTAMGVVEVYQGTFPLLVQGQTGGMTHLATFPVVLQ